MGRKKWHEAYIRNLFSELRDRNLDSAKSLNDCILGWCPFEFHSRPIVGSAKVSWVVDIRHDLYLEEWFFSSLDAELRLVNALQTSLNDWWESGHPIFLYSLGRLCWNSSEASIPSFAVVVSAVVLLALVYQYPTGNVDRGGSKAYSRSSLDFRDIYVAIVLFLGAYVWIKFREVAFRGVHPRTLPDKQGGTKVVYEARLTPPMWNHETVPRLDLGRFATPQEAHNKFLIAAFYYDRDAGWLDGWFQVPPMSEEERRRIRTGQELRKWVLGQAKEVYNDFKKGQEAEAALVQDLYEACEGQATEERDEVSLDPYGASFSNSAEHQQPALASQVENSGMSMAMLHNHRLECTSHSFDGMHEGPALPNGYGLGSPEGYALPVSQLPPNIESLNRRDRLDLLPTLLGTFEKQSSGHQQPIQEFGAQILQLHGSDQLFLIQSLDTFQQQIFERTEEFRAEILQLRDSDQFFIHQTRLDTFQQQSSEQIEEFRAQFLQLQHQRHIPQQQQLQEPQCPQCPLQFGLPQQHLQGVNQGVPGSEVEMEQSMHQHNYPGLMAQPPDGGEVQEALWEMDIFS